MEIPPQWHMNFMVYGVKKGKATNFNTIDKSFRRLLACIGGMVTSQGFVKLVGVGHYLSLSATIKKTVLANSCRYRT
jgi:hypothetical protein